jgi:endonuclease IV
VSKTPRQTSQAAGMKIGLKVYVTNRAYLAPARKLFSGGAFDFIEVFLVAGESQERITEWINTGIPLAFHAPHSYAGFNPADPVMKESNLIIAKELAAVCHMCRPLYLVFHPGILGAQEEAIRQLRAAFDRYSVLRDVALIENKPVVGMHGEQCVGATPEAIAQICNSLQVGCCLDFGHAVCAAASAKRPWRPFIEEFLALGPKAYHLSDGHGSSETDEHLHIGKGDYDIGWFLSHISAQSLVALETEKDSGTSLDDFAADAARIHTMIAGWCR